MTAQSYSSYDSTPSYSSSERGTYHSRKSSTASNATLRELMRSWGGLSATPPSCQAVSFSSWSRFTAATTKTTPPGELKASDLCKDRGTTPAYDPPIKEWAYMGADQPINCGKPGNIRRGRQQRQRSSPSWMSVSSTSSVGDKTETMQFQKQELKQVDTDSQLTMALKMSSAPQKQLSKKEMMMKTLGLDVMRCAELPSAFESDEEDEDY